MTALAVRDLRVVYGSSTVLDGIDFELAPGSFTALIGPNGAGKSTLLRAIAGLVRPTAGSATCTGTPAFVPQGDRSRLDLPLTVRDVVLLGRIPHRRFWQRLRPADRAAADDALADVGMSEHARCQIGELSGGQRQRVMVARALAQGGPVFLLDEPLTGVDAASASAIIGTLRRLRAAGATILMSTHDLAQAGEICDRLILLNGAVVADGPARAVVTPEVLRRMYGEERVLIDDTCHHDHHGLEPARGRATPSHPEHHTPR